MGKCRYDLSEDCHNKDCMKCMIDKIKAEIDELPSYVARFNGGDYAIHIDKEKVFQIIDKYSKTERSGENE